MRVKSKIAAVADIFATWNPYWVNADVHSALVSELPGRHAARSLSVLNSRIIKFHHVNSSRSRVEAMRCADNLISPRARKGRIKNKTSSWAKERDARCAELLFFALSTSRARSILVGGAHLCLLVTSSLFECAYNSRLGAHSLCVMHF